MLHRRNAARLVAAAGIVVALLALPGCSDASADVQTDSERLVLASTTSTQDSGLFDALLPAFRDAYPEYAIEIVAVGTGEALELGRRKDADVLLVHATASEEEFVEEGYGTERSDVMYNDFVVLGPLADPADVASQERATDAFSAIERASAAFVSRGDESGTHKREMSIWGEAAIDPSGDWYLSVGQGMGDSVRLASEKDAYILCDRATFLALSDDIELELLFEEDDLLYNQYGVLIVSDAANEDGAEAFAAWITGPEAQGIIGRFGYEEFGRALFVPNAKG